LFEIVEDKTLAVVVAEVVFTRFGWFFTILAIKSHCTCAEVGLYSVLTSGSILTGIRFAVIDVHITCISAKTSETAARTIEAGTTLTTSCRTLRIICFVDCLRQAVGICPVLRAYQLPICVTRKVS